MVAADPMARSPRAVNARTGALGHPPDLEGFAAGRTTNWFEDGGSATEPIP
jgi:hypothetical protein